MGEKRWYYRLQAFNRVFAQSWIPVLVGTLTSVAVLGAWQQLASRDQLYLEQLVDQEASSIQSKLSGELSSKIKNLERIALLWKINQGTSKPVWEQDAINYIDTVYGYQAIEWVDSSLRIRWVVPTLGNERLINTDLGQEGRRRITLNVARALNQTILTRKIDLLQGGQGFLAVVPIYLSDRQNASQPTRFDGFIVGAFRFQPLFESILNMPSGYRVQIYDRNELIYAQGSSSVSSVQKSVWVRTYGADWQIKVFATPDLINKVRSPLTNVILWGGLIGAWTLALTVYFGQRSQRYNAKARKINQQLQREIFQRQQVEADLRASKDRWELALRGNNDGIWDWDILTDKIFYSKKCQEILGYYEQYRYQTSEERLQNLHPDDKSKVLQAVEEHLQRKTSFYIAEYRYRCPDGSYKWILDRGQALWDESGKPVRMVGSHTDITERKQAEQFLELQAIIARNMAEGMCLIRADNSIIVYANPKFEQMFGYNQGELNGQHVSCINYAPDFEAAEAVNQSIQVQIFQKGEASYEVHNVKKDGTPFWCSATTSVFRHPEYGDVFVAVHQDITARKQAEAELEIELKERQQAEAELRQAKEQLELVILASHDGFWDWDFRTNKIYYSPRWKEMLGYEDAEFPNTLEAWKSVIFEEDCTKALQLVEDYNTGKIDQFLATQRFHHKSGSTVYILSRAIHLKDEQGQVIRMIGAHSDITEMIQIQEALESSKQSLQEIAEQLAIRVEELKQRNTEMMLLSEMNDFLQACLTVEEACTTITSFMRSLFTECSGSISVMTNSRNRLKRVAYWGNELYSSMSFHSNECWALRRGQLHWINHDHQHLTCQHIDPQQGLYESLCIPLIAQGETLGLLYLCSPSGDRLNEMKQQLARTVAEQIGLAIANLNLRETLQNQSIRDALTGLYNRRYLEECLTKEINRAERNIYPIGIIMLDIDHFKDFNDTLGHDAGDFVLKEIGLLLANLIRSSDTACRYGGEEMTLILPEASLEDTTKKAEELRTAIAQLRLNYNGQILQRLTASLGVACFPAQGTTGMAVLQAADAALYRAKAAGRNQVMIACN